MAKEKICGIYCIENKINHKKYIGQSNNVLKRISNHKNLLNKMKHHNSYLQNSWNIHGEENFKFYILKECSPSDIDYYERYYISLYNTTDENNGYNLESGGNNGKKHSKKTIQKLIEIHKNEKVPVYCIELNKIYDGFIDIEKEFNVSYAAIRKCCVNKRGTCCGYHWLYLSDVTEETINMVLKDNNLSKKEVYCFELDRVFESETIAKIQTGATHIGDCCNGLYGRNSSGKHPITNQPLHWCYLEDKDIFKIRDTYRKCKKPNARKKIRCIETNQTFGSIKDAENHFKIYHVGDVCNGKRKTAGGFTFEYA